VTTSKLGTDLFKPPSNSPIIWLNLDFTDFASQRDVAQETYINAVEYLKRELSGNENALKWLNSHTSLADIRAVVEKARVDYDGKTKSRRRVRTWLTRLSSQIMYYGQVLDTLAQHHPEYVALAWGAVKFVLTVMILSNSCHYPLLIFDLPRGSSTMRLLWPNLPRLLHTSARSCLEQS
jgi:hypothetical protein